MIKVDVDGLARLRAALDAGAKKQLPFATAKALTMTGKEVAGEVVKEMGRGFASASPFYRRAMFNTSATKSYLTVMVGLKDKSAKGTSPEKVFKEFFSGGARGLKPMEKYMLQKGYLESGYRVIPAVGFELDRYGNPSQKNVKKILQAIEDKTQTKGTGKTQATITYFLHKPSSRRPQGIRLNPGIYRRIKQDGKIGKVIPVLYFVKRQHYQKIFDLRKTSEGIVDKNFRKNFENSFSYALRTAR